MDGPHDFTRHLERSVEDENLGPYLNRVIWSLAALTTVFVALRVYCKLVRLRKLWWDDYVLIASWVALVFSIAMQSVAVSYGLGRHYANYTSEQISAVSMYSIIAGFGSILATTWSKTSFALTLLRISTGKLRIFIWFIIISVNIVLGSNGLVQWIQCWPIPKRWHYDTMEGSCFPSQIIQNYNVFFAAFSGLMDIVLALLPWKIIWTVAINKREKLGALVLMSAGVIAGVMAFLKIKTVYVIGNDNATTVDLFIFGTAEPATAIMAAAIPVLRMLIRRDAHSKPTQFIVLGDNGLASSQLPARGPAGHETTKQSAEDTWSKVSHVEHGRLHDRSSQDDEWAD